MTRSEPREILRDRIAAVTGAGSGLGAAMARVFAGAGMAVAALDIDEAAATATAATLAEEYGIHTAAMHIDVANVGSVAAAAQHVAVVLGGCDVLCANVGVQQFGAIDRLTEEDWQWVLGVNVMGTVRTIREFLPLLRARTDWRRIMITVSSGALVPGVRLGAYQTSKFAVMGYGETLRQELADEGIGVNLLFPAGMMTRHLESSALARPAELGESVTLPDDIEVMMASNPMGGNDIATPEHAVRHLLRNLLNNEPYILTHGEYRARYNERRDAIEAAFDRLETENHRSGGMVDDHTTLLRRLADIESIKQLKARYFRLMDQKRWDEWAMVFTSDAHLVVPEGNVDERGRDAVVRSISSVLEGVRTVHHGHTPEIEITGSDTASGTWAMFDYVEFPPDADGNRVGVRGYGHYTEEYVREDGQWRIASLRLSRLRLDPL
jgi:NAD(P)-dependent dehydrogenase (short-subunit alcohol dehydrogenase family)